MWFFGKKRRHYNTKPDETNFRPVHSLEGKSNYKRYFFIGKNGKTTERIFLNVPDIRLREEIICKHYISFLKRNFITKNSVIEIATRDNNWDFGLKMGDDLFNVEIVSVADNDWLREKIKREEIFDRITSDKEIKVRLLRKIFRWFGDMEMSTQKMLFNKDSDDSVPNPFYNHGYRIFISTEKGDIKSYSELLIDAIKSKNQKKHSGKEKTVLIIDNRTSIFSIIDYQKALAEISAQIEKFPFPQIYFYTGYYSDNDATNSEYSFGNMKLPDDMAAQLQRKIESRGLIVEASGVAYE